MESEINQNFKITGNWEELSKRLREKFWQHLDQDIKTEKSKTNELRQRLENRLQLSYEDNQIV